MMGYEVWLCMLWGKLGVILNGWPTEMHEDKKPALQGIDP